MTAARIRIVSDGLNGFDVYDGDHRIGTIWPAVQFPGEWFARPVPPPAQRRPTRVDAVAFLAGVPVEELAHLERRHFPIECVNVLCPEDQRCGGCDPDGDEPCSANPWPCKKTEARHG